MDGFRDAVSLCGFSDLGFIGLPFTWDNHQQGDQNIKVRLDRAFAIMKHSLIHSKILRCGMCKPLSLIIVV